MEAPQKSIWNKRFSLKERVWLIHSPLSTSIMTGGCPPEESRGKHSWSLTWVITFWKSLGLVTLKTLFSTHTQPRKQLKGVAWEPNLIQHPDNSPWPLLWKHTCCRRGSAFRWQKFMLTPGDNLRCWLVQSSCCLSDHQVSVLVEGMGTSVHSSEK